MSDAPRDVIDLGDSVVGLLRSGEARLVETPPGEPPHRVDGLTIGAPFMTHEPPHVGEMHPDGDELLFLVSGGVTVVLEDETPARRVTLEPGQALVVPRGVWHRVLLDQPSRIVHVTPGPNGEHRPLPDTEEG
jgi:mannose-6-phosphate isomerase-like protein (cupin superfamily)